MRGEFVRGWDHGKGIDVDRVFGSWQDSANKSHSHTLNRFDQDDDTGGGWGAQGGDWSSSYYRYNGLRTSLEGEIEARPRNVALLPCIKAI